MCDVFMAMVVHMPPENTPAFVSMPVSVMFITVLPVQMLKGFMRVLAHVLLPVLDQKSTNHQNGIPSSQAQNRLMENQPCRQKPQQGADAKIICERIARDAERRRYRDQCLPRKRAHRQADRRAETEKVGSRQTLGKGTK